MQGIPEVLLEAGRLACAAGEMPMASRHRKEISLPLAFLSSTGAPPGDMSSCHRMPEYNGDEGIQFAQSQPSHRSGAPYGGLGAKSHK